METACSLSELPRALDPLAALEALRGDGHAWLLDSALVDGRLGRFGFLGADPYAVLRVSGRRAELRVRRDARPDLAPGDHALEGDALEWLRRLRPPAPDAREAAGLPFIGGAVCALAYELAEQTLPVRLHAERDLRTPDLCLLLVDRLLAFDFVEGRCFVCGLGFGSDGPRATTRAREAADALARRVADVPPAPRAGGAADPRALEGVLGLDPEAAGARGHFDAAGYAKAVERIREWILDGELYQANLTRRLELPFAGDPWRLYRRLRRLNPAPFAAYLELPGVTVACSSPERFLRLDASRGVEARPIKGTRPRALDPRRDAELARELAASEKDRAENVMIVDLLRNDLGRVCETGSVHVPELLRVEPYASVFQLVSTVRGRLAPGLDVVDLLRASFPPGSMTGAPKLAAVRHIDRLEPVARGLYSGALGYLDARGGADLAVVIRTLLVTGGRAFAHVGGGIVLDSDPQGEFQESADKARALISAILTS